MFLSTDESDRLLAFVRRRTEAVAFDRDRASADFVDRVIIETLLFSGIRNSEFCRLLLADARLQGNAPALLIRAAGEAERTVHIPASLARLIAKYIRQYRSAAASHFDARDPREPLVLNENGKAYERTGLYRRVVRVLTDAGLGDRASVQLLRHTYGYLAYLRTGGNLLFVQRQLGHAHAMVTSIYAQFVKEDYAALANSMGPLEEGHARTRSVKTRRGQRTRGSTRSIVQQQGESL